MEVPKSMETTNFLLSVIAALVFIGLVSRAVMSEGKVFSGSTTEPLFWPIVFWSGVIAGSALLMAWGLRSIPGLFN